MMLMKLEPKVFELALYQAQQNYNSYGAKLVNAIKESDEEIDEIYEGEITTTMSRREWENCILIGGFILLKNNNFNIFEVVLLKHTLKLFASLCKIMYKYFC